MLLTKRATTSVLQTKPLCCELNLCAAMQLSTIKALLSLMHESIKALLRLIYEAARVDDARGTPLLHYCFTALLCFTAFAIPAYRRPPMYSQVEQ